MPRDTGHSQQVHPARCRGLFQKSTLPSMYRGYHNIHLVTCGIQWILIDLFIIPHSNFSEHARQLITTETILCILNNINVVAMLVLCLFVVIVKLTLIRSEVTRLKFCYVLWVCVCVSSEFISFMFYFLLACLKFLKSWQCLTMSWFVLSLI